jgi:hypothetical protein
MSGGLNGAASLAGGIMDVTTSKQLVSDITEYVSKHGGRMGDWYAGSAAHPRTRLFHVHCVNEAGGAWIYRICATVSQARATEGHLLRLGMRGGSSCSDTSTKCVYAYKINNATRE